MLTITFFHVTPVSFSMNPWLCAQRRLRSACASAQSDQSLRCPPEEALSLYLTIERTEKTLIRLGGCPCWSESSLIIYWKKYSNCVNIGFWTIVSSKIGVCESIITYEQKASIPLIAMMYILHRQLNGKFLPLADFWCEPRHSQVKIEGRVTHFSVRKWLTSLVYQGVSTMTCFHIIWSGRHG